VSAVGSARRFSRVAIAHRNPAIWRCRASRASRYWPSLPAMIALAHRALDSAVNTFLRVEPIPPQLPLSCVVERRIQRPGPSNCA
jgi:hypothetical protein